MSFCASQFCLEKWVFFFFLLCLVVLLFEHTFPLFCSLGIPKSSGCLISIQVKIRYVGLVEEKDSFRCNSLAASNEF